MRQRLRKLNRKILILDWILMTFAYLLAIYMRLHFWIVPWQRELYSTVYIAEILIYAMLHVYRMGNRNYERALLGDPIENLFVVLQNQVLLLVCTLSFLVLTQTAQKVSRLVLAINFVLCICFCYIGRMLYRRHEMKRSQNLDLTRGILVITDEADREHVVQAFSSSRDQDQRMIAMITMDDMLEELQSDAVTSKDLLPKIKVKMQEALKNNSANEVFIYLPKVHPSDIKKLILVFDEIGLDSAVSLTFGADDITSEMIHSVGSFRAAFFTSLREKCDILGVSFNISNVKAAVIYCVSHLEELKGKYICFSNVHTTVTAHEDEEYRKIQNSSAFTFADGAPIAKVQSHRGCLGAYRVSGPDFMDAVFRETAGKDIKHYFFGSSQETIDLLREKLPQKYPGLQIVGLESPPFRDLTEEEDKEAVKRINESGADFIWIGLGAPKQEKWMYAHKDRVDGVMLGVGAGFNFYAGNIKRAPLWMQKSGLEWLYRLFQDPKRLFKRYLVTNLKFFWYLFITGEIRKRG